MPTTPRDTLRMVAPASCTNSFPRWLSTRLRKALSTSTSCGPRVNKNPAMTIATRSSMRPNNAPWANTSNLPPAGLSIGATSANAPFILVAASCHN